MNHYDYIIIGAGISGCSVAYELSKHNSNILIVDKSSSIAQGASGAAGAFLSPLLGKPNPFKDLVNKSLHYSTKFYLENFPRYIQNCGTTRIPKNDEDSVKFSSYIPFMDFDFKKDNLGYFFSIGSVLESSKMCNAIIEKCQNSVKKQMNYEVKKIEYKDDLWIVNDSLSAQNIIITTGSDCSLINQFYINMRAVWGQRIDISTTTKIKQNYHKECSLSISKEYEEEKFLVSIGATHHRNKKDLNIKKNILDLLEKANDIKVLEDVKVLNHYVGVRACSIDYFPIVGDIIDSDKTLEEFPYMLNGTNVDSKRFSRLKNCYVLTGVGGRGFVLAPYLAKLLVDNIINNTPLCNHIKTDRLFRREVKRIKK